ncbi:heterokaryon incompatibility protein-domain-containing protein [Stachybotrys elegans]|uniref:Heterokaryon incompatibility protein-domain-containing protein n=1 Tax=Stachybotrys elegans TaxID=80388 RepID=A0A8K0SB96_9HYPO|nr:heterokaryon incompatibility protein-domain-containing protein [Stachybotrys elegans]
MPMSLDKVFYTQLQGKHEIRVAVIQPGTRHDLVSIQLAVVDLDDEPSYDALSYVWGDSLKLKQILCDGRQTAVTANLYWALARVRSPDKKVAVWADAICINQDDLQERSSQVGYMDRVFSNARRVWVCMGDSTHGQAEQIGKLVRDVLKNGLENRLARLRSEALFHNDGRWRYLSKLLRNPWFGRAWVIQEVGLARSAIVLYGQGQFDYRDFMRVAEWAAGIPMSSQFHIGIRFIHTQWKDWSQRSSGYSFLNLLEHASTLRCTDPRDLVYAFLGHNLARANTGEPIITADYTKPYMEVWQEVMGPLLLENGPRALSAIRHDERSIEENWPSWVPRWNTGYEMNNLVHAAERWSLPYKTLTDTSIAPNGDKLLLAGVGLDEVKASYWMHFFPERSLIVFEDSSTGECKSFNEIYGEYVSSAASRADVAKSFVSAIFGGSMEVDDGGRTLSFTASEDHHPFLRKLFSGGQQSDNKKYKNSTHKCWMVCQFLGSGRSFIVTKKGFFGLAPYIARPGDLCYAIAGARVLFAFRPTAGKKSLRVLGESYLQGFMQGEISRMIEGGQLSETRLTVQ